MKSHLLLATLPSFILVAGQFPQKKEEAFNVIKEELAYLSCDVCERLVVEGFAIGDTLREGVEYTGAIGEGDIVEKLQIMCMPKEPEGRWLSRLDIVESKRTDLEANDEFGSVILGSSKKGFLSKAKENNYLVVRDWGMRGHCKEECVTLAKACQNLIDEVVDMDKLGVEVWKGAAVSAKIRGKVAKGLCSEPCSGKRKKLPTKGRGKDFTWLLMSDEEVQMQELMATMEAQGFGPQLYDRDDMDSMVGGGGEMHGAGSHGGYAQDEMDAL